MISEAKTKSRKWFAEARFGMFVHWGLYSIPGRDMWYYSTEEVDKDTYEQLFHRFNPVDYDPVSWAQLAKDAGMKYAVFITKHHDGFCLWDSKYTDFKVTNTPYGKDLLRPWLDAYRAQGIKVGVYYSLIDWNHPHFAVDYRHPQRKDATRLNKTRDQNIYVDYMHNQIRELVTEYGPIDIFWPDFSYGPKPNDPNCKGKQAADWQSEKIVAMLEELQPGILYNNRLGIPGEIKADFTTPEQYIPKEDVAHKDTDAPMWEACETIGASWGYYRGDRDIKSTTRLISDLVTCVSNNGNLLLNVGPTPRGRIQPEFVQRLQQIGAWFDTYGESIYGAGSAKLPAFNADCPERHFVFTQRDMDLYLHFFDRYPPFDIVIPGLSSGDIDYIEFVSDRSEVTFEEAMIDGLPNVRLHLPIIDPDPHDTVIRFVLRDS
ncbi:MAG: alpha-L-fucosidase [Armatimonadota bacterium]